MTTLNIQFTDANEETIESYFAGPQNESEFSNLGTIESNDARWKAYYDQITSAGVIGLPSPE